MASQRYESLYARPIANSHKPDDQNENGCWIWTGNKDSKGYGRLAMRVPGKRSPVGVRAHRAMLEHMLGRKLHPDHETVEHLCMCTSCINPDHLTLLTRAENTALMNARRLKGY